MSIIQRDASVLTVAINKPFETPLHFAVGVHRAVTLVQKMVPPADDTASWLDGEQKAVLIVASVSWSTS
ncbi:hypothetical protein SOVF_041270 [Spinacia oleracea]|nr:hypothetical protein SOVF_041270 [Spinacia oleracea]